jgi:hypothetical protein
MTDRDRLEGATATRGAEEARTRPLRQRPVAATRTPASTSGAPRQSTASPSERSIDELCINTIRTLSMDAVQQANSGHPGTPMAMAPVIYVVTARLPPVNV